MAQESSKRAASNSPLGKPVSKQPRTENIRDLINVDSLIFNIWVQGRPEINILPVAVKYPPTHPKLIAAVKSKLNLLRPNFEMESLALQTVTILIPRNYPEKSVSFLQYVEDFNIESDPGGEIRVPNENEIGAIVRVTYNGEKEGGLETYDSLTPWGEGFIGDAHLVLYRSLLEKCQSNAQVYARYQVILQSSGMGKSRLVDELSKEHLVIPINLRTTGTGFPPGDDQVTKFLIQGEFNSDDAYMRFQVFLSSLFSNAYILLAGFTVETTQNNPQVRRQMLARKFRDFMRENTSHNSYGKKHIDFFDNVISNAKKLLASNDTNQAPADETFKQLHHELVKLLNLLDPTGDCDLSKAPPILLLAFDEAHTLAYPVAPEEKPIIQTLFFVLRRVLRTLIDYPMFGLFLSTTGNMHEFIPPPERDPSARAVDEGLQLFPPFVELGFDQMLEGTDMNKLDIEEVSTIAFMVKFGRPLFGTMFKNLVKGQEVAVLNFAAQKLVGGHVQWIKLCNSQQQGYVTCLSARLALEFNAMSTETRARELEQVEKYMRVCVLVDKGFETMMTISPSEPLLAEAARMLMLDFFDAPRALLEQLEKPGLDKGDRGEVVNELLFILASDMAFHNKVAKSGEQPEDASASRAVPVLSFLKELIAEEWHATLQNSEPSRTQNSDGEKLTFEKTFQDSKIYVSHFIKVNDSTVINRKFLWKLIARGAAILCADGQFGADMLLPFVYTGKWGESDVSCIIAQSKNNKIYKVKPKIELFHKMNPFVIHFFDEDEKNIVPVIRLVFALASSKSNVEVVLSTTGPSLQDAKSPAEKLNAAYPAFTSFDIWLAQTSSATFQVIKEAQNETYAKLLKTRKTFPEAYTSGVDDPQLSTLRRMMNPGTACHKDHWKFFGVDNN